MRIEEFDYELPQELIAQTPLEQRDSCRLMILDRKEKTVSHRHFYDILDYVNSGDCLVLNDSRVIPARMYGLKEGTGAHIELLLIKRIDGDKWECLVRPGKRLHEGDTVILAGRTETVPAGSEPPTEGYTLVNGIENDFKAHILGIHDADNATRLVEFEYDGIFMERLEEIGSMPLPPYITRAAEDSDKEMYQTVYSRIDGSVAAPTAGLHFTKDLLKAAEDKGVRIAYVTLHVGIGTFRPVSVDVVEEHKMHFEECSIDEANAEIINRTIEEGGRIISVGTTSTRTLESMAEECTDTGNGRKYRVKAGSKSTGIFIYPGYEFRIVDALITNFHLPKSTLLMLVSALYDREEILKAYNIAVEEKYRFFSYGDAMLIE
ncbi:MAG: tRNA preQ1(34) S-adenosylmethionine ribosyltransferase-isomerase QueA [Clostridiales bacterium]|nr:tRNA preQ1(34) S-adenosylmethionine ribosyltransferase-isomerase QueA [Clostridiales bacterium]